MKIRIRFDLSRIFARGARLTPTGIDRVDIRYAKMLLANNDLFEFEGVVLHKGHFIFVPNNLAVEICNLVYGQWIDDSYFGLNHSDKVAACLKKLADQIKTTSLIAGTKIDVRLRSGVDTNPGVYINVTFAGLETTYDHARYKSITGDKMLYFIHDLLPLEYPEYFWKDWDKVHLQRILNMRAVADMIATVSNDVAVKLQELFKHLKVEENGIFAIQNGVEDTFVNYSVKAKAEYKPRNQFVIVSTIEPRKNHLMLLEIWRDFIFSGLSDIPKLIIIGSRGWHNSNTFEFLEKCTAIQPYIEEVHDVDDGEMIKHIFESKATLFPSYGEGWGLPVVESMTLGVQAICSDIAVLRECSNNMAEYIEIQDKKKWLNEILRYSRMDDEESRLLHSHLGSFKPVIWCDSFVKLRHHLDMLAFSKN